MRYSDDSRQNADSTSVSCSDDRQNADSTGLRYSDDRQNTDSTSMMPDRQTADSIV